MTAYKPFSTFLFRTPYFHVSALEDFEKMQNAPVFKEMLQIATRDLNDSMDKEEVKALYSAYRYYQRACTRPTPFGLFAGCSIGIIGNQTQIRLTEQSNYKRTTRLDMNYICALTQQLENDRNIREQLLYYLNNSMYTVGDHLRYVEYHFHKMRRVHRIAQVENSEYLQKVLAMASGGALFSNLLALLTDEDITTEEAAEFIHELIDAQVLVSELDPAVTNVRPLISLINRIQELPNTNNQATGTLAEIEEYLGVIDAQSIGSTCDIYPAIVENIEKTKVTAEIKYLFQVDMFKPTQQATISRGMIKNIRQALIFLNKITPHNTRANLSQFKETFYKRYEEREMPLLFVLDNELYIDLNNPLSIRAWLSVVKKRPSFRLEEFLFNPETAVVHGPEGAFMNEFIFAFYRE